MTSRVWRWLGLAVVWGAVLAAPAAADEPAVRRLDLVVRETAGIRRFGYPVTVVLPPDATRAGERFRLLENGKPVPAQFRRVAGRRGEVATVYLDFNVSHGPLEMHTYQVEYGPGVEPGPEPKGGLTVKLSEDTVTVAHGGELEFVLPRQLPGLIRQVRGGRTEYLRGGSPGLLLRDRAGQEHRAGAGAARVTRSGPLAAGVRFEGSEGLAGGKITSALEMEFPRSKSWVRVSWALDDTRGDVTALGAELNLAVQGPRTLVDFGAGSYVYAALRPGESAVLRAGPPWATLVGRAGALRPYVVAPADGRTPPAEGWAHVMDRERCTAVAVAGFAAGPGAEIAVGADGRLRLWRPFSTAVGPKRLTFWLHFVGMPVQVGAATSPQAMLAPLRVEVRAAGESR
jgi:hypothetical protein